MINLTLSSWRVTRVFLLLILPVNLACTPFHRMMLSPAHRSSVLRDSCDVHLVLRAKELGGSLHMRENIADPPLLWDDIDSDPDCGFLHTEHYSRRDRDSALWFLAIRPAYSRRDTLLLGSLYTIPPGQNSRFVVERRVKEYSQTETFESGKYLVFTYYLEGDSIIVVKTGSGRY